MASANFSIPVSNSALQTIQQKWLEQSSQMYF